jgi:hypothetical protein
MARSSIKVRDNGANALLKRMRAARGRHAVTVGLHAEEGAAPHGDGTTVLDVAAFHEFGTTEMDGRQPIGGWFDANEQKNTQKLQAIADGLVSGKAPDLDRSLDAFGAQAVTDLRAHMGRVPSLEEDDPTPLDDTGKLKASMTHRLEK